MKAQQRLVGESGSIRSSSSHTAAELVQQLIGGKKKVSERAKDLKYKVSDVKACIEWFIDEICIESAKMD